MLTSNKVDKVFLACGATDMRLSINGLAILVKEVFKLDPFSNCLFVFCNKKRDKLKILYWDHNGFWLFYRRLEEGTFKFPGKLNQDTKIISQREFNWLLDGLHLIQKEAHPKVTATYVV